MPQMSAPCRALLAALLVVAALPLAVGCKPNVVEQPPTVAPSATLTGPAYLHGTVGSLANLRGYEPLRVSGYGLVVDLPGTGSADVPAFLRSWMINEMRKRGLGSSRLNTTRLSPERVLASENTAVVLVEGFIPPGAQKGTRFDVLVSALPQTQTTNLEGGRLWTTSLAIRGANEALRFSTPLGTASGPMYVNPLEESAPEERRLQIQRQAVILAGGQASEDRQIDLVLNQPSYLRSRMIADRINERFPAAPNDHDPTAVAKTDETIALNIPKRFGDNPDALLELISYLYVQRGPDFEPQQARRLVKVLEKSPDQASAVTLAWIALGKTVLPVLRDLYQHPQTELRMAALEAGARLQDELVTQSLDLVTKLPDAALRKRAAQLLGYLPKSMRGSRLLRRLVDDQDTQVRLAAYESLARIGDPLLQRKPIVSDKQLKMLVDLVPSDKPMVYATQKDVPRLAIFSPDTGFTSPLLARLWDNRLMLRGSGKSEPMTVFYQGYDEPEAKTLEVAPTLGNLVFLLGHDPSPENPTQGLDLTYSQVVNAVHELHQQGKLEAPVHVHLNELAQRLDAYEDEQSDDEDRPETSAAALEPMASPQP